MNQQIIGTVSGLEQRNGGWVAVAILAPGKEYPVKLSTKKTDLIQQAQQMMGQVVTAGYNEAEGNSINPHTGTPYINRYLEAIAFGQVDLVGAPTQIQPQNVMPQQPQPQQFQGQPQTFAGQQPAVPFTPQPQPIQQPHGDLREAKIHRQAAAKVSVQLLQYLTPDQQNLASLIAISEQLVKYFDNGVQWTTPPIQAPQPQAQQQHQQGPDPEPSLPHPGYGDEPGDDGIPF